MEIDFPSVRRSLWKLPPARRKIEAARSRPFVCDRSLLFVAPSTRPARVFRNTACKSVRFAVVAQGSHHRELPTGMPDPLLHQCFPALYFQFLTANCCAQVHMEVGGCVLVCVPSTVLAGSHDERRSLGNPAKVRRIPGLTGKCTKRSVRRSLSRPPDSFRVGERQTNPC